jgi:hypothetical protein
LYQNVPGKLLLFYRLQDTAQVWALVHCCGYETFTEGMFESSKIISCHELSFQPSSTHRSVPTLEHIIVDSISHRVVGIKSVSPPFSHDQSTVYPSKATAICWTNMRTQVKRTRIENPDAFIRLNIECD